MKTYKCKSCGAEIVWITTRSGKNMPCDAKPVDYQENSKAKTTLVTEDGRVIKASVFEQVGGGLLKPIVDGQGYVPHWATCPYAKLYRNGGGGK